MINLEKLKTECARLSQQLAAQEFIQQRDKYTQLARRFAYLEKLVKLLEAKQNLCRQQEHLREILAHPTEAEELKILAAEAIAALDTKIISIDDEIEEKVFSESETERDLIIEIRSAAGGEEAALFAGLLFKMYSR